MCQSFSLCIFLFFWEHKKGKLFSILPHICDLLHKIKVFFLLKKLCHFWFYGFTYLSTHTHTHINIIYMYQPSHKCAHVLHYFNVILNFFRLLRLCDNNMRKKKPCKCMMRLRDIFPHFQHTHKKVRIFLAQFVFSLHPVLLLKFVCECLMAFFLLH